jgi:DNA-directed DNA polymerase III PolC
MDTFIHLEVQSAYSFLWGTFTPEELVQAAVSLGQKAVALTDYGFHGVLRFYKAALKAGLQPIVGAKVTIWDGSQITLLARDFQGYGNLCRLLSIALGESVSPTNPLSKQDISHYTEGLVCLAGGRDSLAHESLKAGRAESAKIALLELRDALRNPELLFVVLQNHSRSEEDEREARRVMALTAKTALEIGLPIVAANAVTFINPEDYLIHRAFVAVQRRHHHRSVQSLPNSSFYLASGEEMARRIPYPEAIENTARIASLCESFSLPVGRLHPPSFQDAEEAFANLAKLGYRELAQIQNPVSAPYIRQLDHELEAIRKTKLADFFLLVRRIVEFAHKSGIRHSIRGSAAGSLLVYLLLGGVDPLAHNLLFERFINEGRGDMPDIDIDFDSDRRDEVIRRLMEMFPHQTAMVCTVLSFKARSAVRLIARAMGYPLDEIDRLSDCLPWSLRGGDLQSALEKLPELKDSPIKEDPLLLNVASKIVGLPHQSSVHLGGVIIVPDNIKDWTPVGVSPKGMPVGQLDKDDVGALGLMKLDLLGLRMHMAIRKALELLWRKGISLDLDRMPLDDRDTYSLLCDADSVGVFQLESPGQRNLLGRLQPRRFSDLIAEISLFRPGPVEGNIVEPYVRRRNNLEKVTILHPDLKSVLGETYGVIVFQEQVLRIVNQFAGLPYAEADAFRRAMTKDRKSDQMQSLKEKFIQGALKKGYAKALAERAFRMVAAFASFGFCKAHAASFSHITYQSAFLKAHHPQAFYLGLLNAGHVGSYPPRVILNEARRRGIQVYPPDVNASGLDYKAEGPGIRTPFAVVNGVGPAMSRRIVADRERRGPFLDREDFLARLSPPANVVATLSLAGAFDGLEEKPERIREASNV